MNLREQRGKVIADTCTITKVGKLWHVPSQSGRGTYSVNLERVYCSCPDFAEHGVECKHLFAVKFQVTKTEHHADGSETVTRVTVEQVKKVTYKQDWPAYNAAQTNEDRHFQAFLAEMCGRLPEPAPQRGAQKIRPADAAFAAVYKVYSTMSARRFAGTLAEAQANGFLSAVPHYNSILKFMEQEESTPILQDFVELSAAPLTGVESAFATDSTGFSGARCVKWFDEKYGKPRSEVMWLKLHATVGVKTNVVTACKVTEKDGADTKQFKELAEKTAEQFDIKEMSADKAYASRDNCNAMDKIGGQFYPAFRQNTTGDVGGSFQKVFHLMKANEEEYMKHYHKRSNVESTFSAMKRKFGDNLRSKTTLAMTNEILAKVVCHNLSCVIHTMYELGMDPEFIVKKRCPPIQEVAHPIY